MDICTAGAGTAVIRVLILAAHQLVRSALAELLREEGFDVIAAEARIAAAVHAAAAAAPDVVLLGNRLADGTGIEACRALREASPCTRCIIMTAYDDRKALRAAALAGAAGYVPQSPRTGLLIDAVRRAAAGKHLHSPEAAMALARAPEAYALLRGAHEPERAIWYLLLEGRTNSQISAELAVAPEDFCTHLSALLARLGYRPAPDAQDDALSAAPRGP